MYKYIYIYIYIYIYKCFNRPRVFVRKLLRNFCGTKRKVLLPVRKICAKEQHFAQLSAKVISRKILLYHICATLFCKIAFAQFRYFAIFLSLMISFLGNENQSAILDVFWGSLMDVSLYF